MKSAKLANGKMTALVKEFGKNPKNTGASEVQIAIFTERINYLTEHFKTAPKDHHSRKGLLDLVNKRKKLLLYLKRVNQAKYEEILKRLDLRK